MTPFELDILLHYYAIREDHPVVDRQPPIWPETCDAFLNEGLIEIIPVVQRQYCTYRLTERGKAYIEHVLAVPLPVVKWVLPDTKAWRGPTFPPRHDDIGSE